MACIKPNKRSAEEKLDRAILNYVMHPCDWHFRVWKQQLDNLKEQRAK
jgi:hypothetical protein